MSRRTVLLVSLIGVFLGGLAAPPGFADDNGEAAAIHYRRILAPADRIQDWPVGDTKYLPLDTAEFERLLAVAQSDSAAVPLTRMASARYQARLIGNRLSDGKAIFDVVHAGGTPALFSLTPCSLALGKAHWMPREAKSNGPGEPALLGSAADGRVLVRVERSGQLQIEWTLAGHRDATDVICFVLDLPRCAIQQLALDLPEGVSPTTDVGMVWGKEPAGERTVRWHIDLGGHQRVRLRLLQAGASSPRSLLALLRESSVYDLSIHGLEVSSQWRIQAHNEPLRQVTLLLDPGLQLATAYCGDHPVPWTLAAAPADGQPARIVLALPEPIQDGERVLRLGAVAPLVLDHSWRLPRIRVDGLTWQEGDIALLTPEPLVINRISATGCAQTGTEPLAAPRTGESMKFQCFDPNAALEIVLARRNPAVQLSLATDVVLSRDETTARVAGDFRVAEGAQPLLEGTVARHWMIDSVDSVPAAAIADWTIESQPGGSGLLSVRLSKALSPARPVRLLISARQIRVPTTQSCRASDLLPVAFRDVVEGRHLVSLRCEGPYDLKCSDVERLRRVNAEKLSAAELDLFLAPPSGLLFECDDATEGMSVALVARKPRYSAAIQMESVVGDRTMRESYTFRCTPESGRVDRVFVRFYPPRDVAPRWTIAGEDGPPAVRLLSNEEQAAEGLDASAEVWEIALRRARSAAFEIAAVRDVNGLGQQPLSLASLPEAGAQRGTLVIRRSGPNALQIENRRLEPIPPASIASERAQSIQGTYRYDPSRDTASGPEAAICVTCVAESPSPGAWIWLDRMESWYGARGDVRHLVAYELHNSGCERFSVRFPASTQLEDIRGVWVDDETATWSRTDSGEGRGITIDLPSNRGFPTVSVEWTAPSDGLGLLGTLNPPLLEASLPVLARRWTAWLPPEYDFSSAPGVGAASSFMAITWRQRLFGPLGRAADAMPFNPLSAEDWGGLMTPGTPPPASAVHVAPPSSSTGTADPRQGWIACEAELSTQPPTLHYVRRDTMRLLAAIAFLLTFALGCWTFAGRPILVIAWLVVFAASALLLPSGLAPIASSAVVGMLFSVAIGWRRQRAAQAAPATRAEDSLTVSAATPNSLQVGAVLLALGIGWATGARASGQTAADLPDSAPGLGVATRRADGAPPYRVMVPIDAHQKPTGDRVYLPEPFYQELLRRDNANSGSSQGWLIVSANYRGALTRDAVSGRLLVEKLRAQYDLQVFAAATRVRIPIRADAVSVLPGGVSIDGRVVQPEWEPHSVALSVDIADPGPCRLELDLRPTLANAGGSSGFDFAIPRAAHSRIELTLPEDAPGIQVASARGMTPLDHVPPRWCADVGPVDRLTVRWKDGGLATPAAPAASVEQLMWLKVLPGSVVIDAKFKLRAVGTQRQQIELITDRRLRLLPMLGDDLPTVGVRAGPRQSKLLSLRWPRPLPEETTLNLSFLWTETSGVGSFRLPQLAMVDSGWSEEMRRANGEPAGSGPSAAAPLALEPQSRDAYGFSAAPHRDHNDAQSEAGLAIPDQRDLSDVRIQRADKRWLAVTVDPTLDRDEQHTAGLEVETAAEFLKFWGAAEANPQSVYQLLSDDTDWNLSTRPHAPGTTSNESLAWCFDRDSVELEFNAQLSTTAGYVFQYRIAAPSGLKIERVSLLEDNAERASRWSQDADGSVTVFLSGPVTGQQKLAMRGRLAVSPGDNWAVPRIYVEQCQVRSTVVQLFRRPAVQLAWQSRETSAKSQGLPDSAIAHFGRFVTAFRVDESRRADITVTVKPNDPQVSAQQLLSLLGSGRTWTARLDCSVNVRNGVLDQVRIQAPAPWNGPYRASIPGTLTVVDVPGEGRQLVLQSRAPITGNLDFSVSGPLELARGDRPSLPDVGLRDIDAIQRWIALPSQVQEQPIVWHTRGLRRCGKADRPSVAADPASTVYAVVAEPAQAVLEPSRPSQGAMFVRLADIALTWMVDGTCHGAALFDIEPGGATECPLSLPMGQELVQVLIDGTPAATRALDDRDWRIALSSKRLPQRVEVVFRGQTSLPNSAGRQTLQSPTLGNWDVQQTLWTIVAPRAFAAGTPLEGETITPWQQPWLRWQNVAAIIKSAYEASDDGADETSRWYPVWLRRLAAVRDSAQRELALANGEEAAAARSQCGVIEAEQMRIAERLDAIDAYKQLSAASPGADASSDLWKRTVNASATPTRCVAAGRCDSITVEYRRAEGAGLAPTWAAVAVLALLAAVAIAAWNRGVAFGRLKCHPYAVVTLAGIAWWLWLWPSVLGLFLVVGGLLAAGRRRLRPNR